MAIAFARFFQRRRNTAHGPARSGRRFIRTLTPRSRTLALEPLEDRRLLTVLARVADTTSFPYSAAVEIASVWDTNDNGLCDVHPIDEWGGGSGAMLDSYHVLMAGHAGQRQPPIRAFALTHARTMRVRNPATASVHLAAQSVQSPTQEDSHASRSSESAQTIDRAFRHIPPQRCSADDPPPPIEMRAVGGSTTVGLTRRLRARR